MTIPKYISKKRKGAKRGRPKAKKAKKPRRGSVSDEESEESVAESELCDDGEGDEYGELLFLLSIVNPTNYE